MKLSNFRQNRWSFLKIAFGFLVAFPMAGFQDAEASRWGRWKTTESSPTVNHGSFELSANRYSVREDAGRITIVVKRVGGSSGAATVDIRTRAETAQTPTDFVGMNWTTLRFANGETQKTQNITIVDNKVVDGDKTFRVLIGNPTGGATLGSVTSATVTIVDDDKPSSSTTTGNESTSSTTSGSSTSSPSLARTQFSLRGDPNFSSSKLSSETRLWHDRLWSAINNSRQTPNASDLAASNNVYDYGRGLNTYITTLLHGFRATGDLRLLDEVDRLTEIMRSKLKDSSILTKGGTKYQSDGYLNWLYLREKHSDWHETDLHEMDEILTHSMISAAAYAFYVNRDINKKYEERSKFWTNYLKNHFEAKWRARKRKSSGFPFLEKKLTHAYAQWNRYHYYMYKLTGEKGYHDEAAKMAQVIKNGVKTVNSSLGQAAIWDHGMPHFGGKSHGPQPVNYARYTIQAMADLHFEGFSVYAEPGFMEKVANTVSAFVLKKAPSALADKIDGSGSSSISIYGISPFATMSLWDQSGLVKTITQQIYHNIESNTSNPRRVYMPTGFIMSTMKK
jgi:hypothetical protein